jgi:nucleoside-diphosphate-sugar epimerase/pimeloyl-ACP methyl ester carboxylesterase
MNRLAPRDPGQLLHAGVRPKNILLTGATGFLGGHFLLKRIEWPGHIYALVRGESEKQARARLYAHLSECAASYGTVLPKKSLDEKLTVVVGDITEALCGQNETSIDVLRAAGIDEFWHCAASLKFEDRYRKEIFQQNIDGSGNMLDLFLKVQDGSGATGFESKEFVHISTGYSAGKASGDIPEALHSVDRVYNNAYEESKNRAENLVADVCERHGISYRILRPTIVMGPRASHHSGTTRFGVYGLAKEVHRLRDTLSKLKHPLELIGDMGSTANLTPVDECVYDMLALSAAGFGDQRFFHLSNPQGVSMPKLIAMIDSRTGANRLAFVTERTQERSPLQRLFDKRTKFYSGYYDADKNFLRKAPPQNQLDWNDVDMYLSSYMQELKHEEAGGIGFKLQTVSARDGSALKVFSCGDAGLPPLILANAYGMPAEFMWPLAQRLKDDFHVVTWECRWMPNMAHAFDSSECSSLIHAQDMIDIADALKLGSVGVAGWSSGAQVTLRAMAHFPDRIEAGVILNPGVSIIPSETVRVTRFETGIRSLFPKIAGSYRMAEKYCELIYGASGSDADDNKTLNNILTSTDPYLLYMTSLPFRTPESLYRYAHMMHSMFSERPDAWTHDVKQAVLVYVGEQDIVTHPDVGRELCRGLRHGELHLDGDGDHFSHYYDARVADLIRSFVGQNQLIAA